MQKSILAYLLRGQTIPIALQHYTSQLSHNRHYNITPPNYLITEQTSHFRMIKMLEIGT